MTFCRFFATAGAILISSAIVAPGRGAVLAGDVAESSVTPSVEQRFAGATDEVPDFRRHVVPLLGRVGCNGRACHGSFQGKGGLRLSLFGYDFEMDHAGLTTGDEPRVDLKAPKESLILQKPTLTQPHEGGMRMEVDSWQYRVLLRWIESGAAGLPKKHANLERLEVQPAEILFQGADQSAQLQATAVWSDGTREDVTPLCRFQSNNDEIAKVNATGSVTAGATGDTHVVVFYDNGVVPISVMRPVSKTGDASYPDVPAPTEIDRLVLQKLRKMQIVSSDVSNDAEFLRRVSLDMTGSLPTPTEIEQFLADSSPTKRSAKIDELLERPTYAAWWASRLCDLTGNNDTALNNVIPKQFQASRDWYEWLERRVADNVAYDKIVEGLMLAVSRDSEESYEDYCRNLSEIYATGSSKTFADRSTMPHYWARRTVTRPADRALSVAYSFLGVRIQCAECHKHPFDQWTQQDYEQFTNLFTQIRFGLRPDARKQQQEMIAELGLANQKGGELQRSQMKLLAEGKVVPVLELFTVTSRRPAANKGKDDGKAKKANLKKADAKDADTKQASKNNQNKKKKKAEVAEKPVTAKLLGGATVDLRKYDDPRTAVMDWLRDPQNPYFARAFVNRVWTAYFNVGIVEPPDDLSLANPPSNRELLDYLSKGFIDHHFDMQWLHREIANSRTYQLSWKSNDSNRLDERNFSHAIVRRLPAEVCYDALQQATASNAHAATMQTEVTNRAIAVPGTGRGTRQTPVYALTVFGRSTRDTNCDCDRSNQVSLLQTVFTRNDEEVYRLIDRKGDGFLVEMMHQFGLKAKGAVAEDDGEAKSPQGKAKRQLQQVSAQIAKLKKEGKDADAAKLEPRLKQLEKRVARAAKQLTETDSQPVVAPKPKRNDKAVDYDLIATQAYLRTLSRYPTDEELGRSRQHLEISVDKVEGIRSLLWALLNTKEFIVNH